MNSYFKVVFLFNRILVLLLAGIVYWLPTRQSFSTQFSSMITPSQMIQFVRTALQTNRLLNFSFLLQNIDNKSTYPSLTWTLFMIMHSEILALGLTRQPVPKEVDFIEVLPDMVVPAPTKQVSFSNWVDSIVASADTFVSSEPINLFQYWETWKKKYFQTLLFKKRDKGIFKKSKGILQRE